MPAVTKSADISPCGTYRYRLTRSWDDQASIMRFIMLNPSTADADVDDPTIRRCMGFARREGCGSIVVVNLFAYRATKPADLTEAIMERHSHAWEGREAINQEIARAALSQRAGNPAPVVAAWGANWRALSRRGISRPSVESYAEKVGAKLTCLGLTGQGDPRHPLYVKGDAPLVAYR